MPLWNHKKNKLGLFTLLQFLIGIVGCGMAWAQQETPLATGNWAKLGITKTGIYKIDGNLLKKLGWNPDLIDPRTLRIYGNGGSMLPQSNDSSRPVGVLENAAWMDGEEDGRWDASDALYFLGEGPHQVDYNTTLKALQHQNNTYSDTSFYFITHSGSVGLRVESTQGLSPSNTASRTYYDDYWFLETERYNLLQSGRSWWGAYLGGAPYSLSAVLPDLLANSALRIDLGAIASAQVPTSVSLSLSGQNIGLATFSTVPGQTYTAKASSFNGSFTTSLGAIPANSLQLTLAYDNKGQLSAQSFLDFVGIQSRRKLVAYEQQLYHFLPAEQDTMQMYFQKVGSDWQLWDVSSPRYPQNQVLSGVGTDKGFVKNGHKQYQRYIGFYKQNAFTLDSWQLVPNQKLVLAPNTELVIVTAPVFVKQAQRLADHRREVDGVQAEVVTTPQIFNQYSSGKVDPTAIRDFARDGYNNGNLKYLLLFGDATYDYKNNLQNQTPYQRGAWVPTYESRESLLPIYTYASDDYFGFLDPNEGAWLETVAGDHLLDIGIGRLPVRSEEEAKNMVDKLIHYQALDSKGSWRNRIGFVADDGDGEIHQYHATQLANLIDADFLTQKIFLDEYPQLLIGTSTHVPQVNQRIRNTIDQGSLILNYTGHGGVNGWAQEQVLTLPDMLNARGYNNLPVLVTATCDFGRYDDMAQVSGAELMVLSPRGAAIAALSTTRPVYSSTNFTLNKALYQALSGAEGVLRMGDLVRQTKNNALVGSLNRNFTLLGDPSMPLVDRTRRIGWQSTPDTLRPGQSIGLMGKVSMAGQIDEHFKGSVYVSIYGKPRKFTTLGDEGEQIEYQDHRDKLYEGIVSVNAGQFELKFIVPVDAPTEYEVGRLSAYALSEDGAWEAQGQCPLVLGGTLQVEQDSPSEVTAYMNDRSFRDGDKVPPSSVMVIQVRDAQGINLMGQSQGRSLTVTLNDTLEIELNDYYRANLDDFTQGSIVYPFQDLPEAVYHATVKIYDSYNNLSKITFGFEVGASTGITMTNVVIYPNPFKTEWSFDLEHNRAEEDIEIEMKVLTISGALVGTEKWIRYNAPVKLSETLRTNALTRGLHINQLYIYMLSIKSLKDNTAFRYSGRLMRSP